MTLVVICVDYGGFSLSRKAFLRLREMGNKYALEEPDDGEPWEDGSIRTPFACDEIGSFLRSIPRDDPDFIKVVEEMGDESNGSHAKLKIIEIPDGVEWKIEEYDGWEHIAEKHRTWPE